MDFLSSSDVLKQRWGDLPPGSANTNSSQVDFNATLSSQTSYSQAGPPQRLRTYPIPPQSPRVALILNRFSENCFISYCSNSLFVQKDVAVGRPFFDYVTEEQEALVRQCINTVKGWGVNDCGQPS